MTTVVASRARPRLGLGAGGPPPSPTRRLRRLSALTSAVVEAVAYADVFDWAVTPAEIHRYLPLQATLSEVVAQLEDPSISPYLERHGPMITLHGRADLVAIRDERTAAARDVWPRAIRYGGIVARLPFVRMVAVTGSLAVDAADRAADVDLLVVTADGRLWLSRMLTMAVVRAAVADRVRLCPNYLLAESALQLDDRSLFTAHEIAQMVPIAASPAYDDLLRRNAWVRDFLPNAEPRPPLLSGEWSEPTSWRRAAEASLRTRLGDAIERWEMDRKVHRLSAESRSVETRYDAAACKGHTEEHGRRALAAFEARLSRLEAIA